MEYRHFDAFGENVSLLGLGCMRLPTREGSEEIDETASRALIDQALAEGITYFDTAYNYLGGQSEAFVGKALANRPRSSYYLASKLPVFMDELKTREDAERIFAQQLERCRTPYFDFYLLHSLSRKTFEKCEELGLYDMLAKKKREGLIRHIGFSFHSRPEVLAQICDAHAWDFAQLQINYLDWEQYRSREQYEILRERRLPCIIMEPVRGGLLADLGETANGILRHRAPGRSIASWALRFAGSLPGVLTVLSGMSTETQLTDNLQTFSPLQPLNREEQAALDEALASFRSRLTIPCTGCRYCMPCPFGVNIPDVFALFNKCALQPHTDSFEDAYKSIPQTENAAYCTHCGACGKLCPQRIDIPTLMGKIHAGEPPV